MFHLTKNIRRATIDIDMDLINASIATEKIINIFIELSKLDEGDGFKVKIGKNKIEELSHQDYHRKRITVTISDQYRNSYSIKLDVGVHNHMDIHQDTLLLDTKIIDGNIRFLVNPKEQIFTEKIIPLLKFGPLSTRYRDIFDIYWLITNGSLDREKVLKYMKILIFDNDIDINNIEQLSETINIVLHEQSFIQNLSSNNNWTNESIENIIETVINYLVKLEKIKI